MSSGRTELFYSKSKNKADLGKGVPATWRRQLSNFWPVEVTIDGRTYPSVEAAFQAAKAMRSSKPDMARKFEVGGSVGPDPSAAKQEGTNKAYRAEGAVLKAKDWNAERDAAMFELLQARYATDPEFRQILEASKAAGVNLLHYERSAGKAYWGGAVKDGAVVGVNRLGKMMMALRDGKTDMETAMQEEGEAAAAAPAPAAAAPAPAAAAAAAAPAAAAPSMAAMGRVSDSVTAVSFARKVFTARATQLSQLAGMGYKVGHLQGSSPADVDRQIQNQELNFVVSPTAGAGQGGTVHVRFHIEKALRQMHVHNLAAELRDLEGFHEATDTLVLVSKDMPNDSVKSAISSVWAADGTYIVVRSLAELQFDVLKHRDVPPHKVMTRVEVAEFKRMVMLGANGVSDLTGMSRFDPVARAILIRPGQLCDVLRPSLSAGMYHYYRVCE